MAVGGEDEGHIERLGGHVRFALLESVSGRQILGLRLDQGYSDRLAGVGAPFTRNV